MKTLQIRLPDALREEADSVLEEIGMDMSTAVRVYLKKIVQNRGIPFVLEAAAPRDAGVILVDEETQTRMDRVAESWKHARR